MSEREREHHHHPTTTHVLIYHHSLGFRHSLLLSLILFNTHIHRDKLINECEEHFLFLHAHAKHKWLQDKDQRESVPSSREGRLKAPPCIRPIYAVQIPWVVAQILMSFRDINVLPASIFHESKMITLSIYYCY